MAPDPLVLGLLVVLTLAFAATTVLLWQVRRELASEGGAGGEAATGEDGAVDADTLAAALSRTFREFDVERTMADLEGHAAALREIHGDIETMLAQPQERGEFGEVQLDVILADHLPPETYGIREQVVDGKTPDAHIRSSDGIVAVDAKFPLENYLAAREAETDGDRRRAANRFARDVEGHLEKIGTDYVKPEAGTARFAFAFIPSEAVYYHLVTEERDLLRAFAGRGVQVVSPLTLGQKLELVRADVHAQQLGEEAEAVRADLQRLGTAFEELTDEWETLQRHVRHAHNKAADVDRAYDRLRDEFQRVEAPALGPEDRPAAPGGGGADAVQEPSADPPSTDTD
jgi:DNA recombination protein RmuC